MTLRGTLFVAILIGSISSHMMDKQKRQDGQYSPDEQYRDNKRDGQNPDGLQDKHDKGDRQRVGWGKQATHPDRQDKHRDGHNRKIDRQARYPGRHQDRHQDRQVAGWLLRRATPDIRYQSRKLGRQGVRDRQLAGGWRRTGQDRQQHRPLDRRNRQLAGGWRQTRQQDRHLDRRNIIRDRQLVVGQGIQTGKDRQPGRQHTHPDGPDIDEARQQDRQTHRRDRRDRQRVVDQGIQTGQDRHQERQPDVGEHTHPDGQDIHAARRPDRQHSVPPTRRPDRQHSVSPTRRPDRQHSVSPTRRPDRQHSVPPTRQTDRHDRQVVDARRWRRPRQFLLPPSLTSSSSSGSGARSSQCGSPADPVGGGDGSRKRVVGGHATTTRSFPWTILIKKYGHSEVICGGAILSDRLVLTAAHCFDHIDRNEMYMVMGVDDMDAYNPHQRITHASDIAVHEDYDSATMKNDIAIVRTTSRISFDTNVGAVCLPGGGLNVSVGDKCLFAGYGDTHGVPQGRDRKLNYMEVPLVNSSLCAQSDWLGSDFDAVRDVSFCAGYPDGGPSSCSGDSGGALVCLQSSDQTYVAVGISSWGKGCGEKNRPPVFTNIVTFVDWIQTKIQFFAE